MRPHRTVSTVALTVVLITLGPALAACSSGSPSPGSPGAARSGPSGPGTVDPDAVDPDSGVKPSESTASGRTVATYTAASAMSADQLQETVRRLKERAAAFGLTGTRIEQRGNVITADAPGDSGDRLRQLAATAELAFRAVKGDHAEGSAEIRQRFDALTCPVTGTPPLSRPEEPTPACDAKTGQKYLLGPVALDGEDVKSAKPAYEPNSGQWMVNLNFTERGAKTFGTVTAALAQETPPANQFAILLDDDLLSAPAVQQAITDGAAQIFGDFDRQRAEDLAALIGSGALPVRLTVSGVTRQP
ncbi:preprotein translocase subunit SecD [Streptomyces sp. NPDC093221]|uniref:preprotein translocase subunit SecD n=1 Tax=Streptomyces sp. NPDC093221 TaxID=3366032 RepID=UPI0037F8CA56